MKQVNLLLVGLLISAGLYAQRVTYYTPSMYRNLEKYWWYRYRLVNDFMKIGTACGESIPMEKWDFNCGSNYPDTCMNTAHWADATQHLGNYINALAGEWRILHDNGLDTRRTEEELYYALYAFERLDRKAEPSWRAYDNVYPYCGFTDFPPEIAGTGSDINGFFIRDDVPQLQFPVGPGVPRGFDNFVTMNQAHFHRAGFSYNTPGVVVESDYGTSVNVPGHPYASSGYARGPREESQDQAVMLYAGMGMAGFLLGPSVYFQTVGI
ncbi:MAG: hypothetical protein JST36_07735 [Bacteroidetes bacterium]|nr:hypothetical protein [Bacteroidota bacterium]